jgi:hypothetical protein
MMLTCDDTSLQDMIEEDQGFAMQQSIGNMTTIGQRYSPLNKALA